MITAEHCVKNNYGASATGS